MAEELLAALPVSHDQEAVKESSMSSRLRATTYLSDCPRDQDQDEDQTFRNDCLP
jgi:hypothetical protein